MKYCELNCIHRPTQETRSPVVFIHGFPDSPLMWQAYHSEAERAQPWLAGRAIYTFAFPNRETRPQPIPSWGDVRRGVLDDELATAFATAATNSPTGQIIPIAHDLGATYTWRYVRTQGSPPFEKMVSLSVASTNRYDVWEHGINAFTWLYQIPYILPYTVRIRPFQNLLGYLLTRVAGYRSTSANETWRDTYHYLDGWFWPIKLPFYFFGILGRTPEYLDFTFPVLFMRSHIDRIATTKAFEAELQRRHDCECHVLPGVNHWFPMQRSELVLAQVRRFLA
ncbi:MAG: alpha/beta hydrolase [Anaerolineales bacterium]|nr:alpha/beta hydrolase [Anaerolineales bacterium]